LIDQAADDGFIRFDHVQPYGRRIQPDWWPLHCIHFRASLERSQEEP